MVESLIPPTASIGRVLEYSHLSDSRIASEFFPRAVNRHEQVYITGLFPSQKPSRKLEYRVPCAVSCRDGDELACSMQRAACVHTR